MIYESGGYPAGAWPRQGGARLELPAGGGEAWPEVQEML